MLEILPLQVLKRFSVVGNVDVCAIFTCRHFYRASQKHRLRDRSHNGHDTNTDGSHQPPCVSLCLVRCCSFASVGLSHCWTIKRRKLCARKGKCGSDSAA